MKQQNTTTNFVRFFGKNTKIKVLDFLIENNREAWNQGEIMSNANVGHTCLLTALKTLIELEIVKVENKKYFLNKQNKIVKLLISFHVEINKNKLLREDV